MWGNYFLKNENKKRIKKLEYISAINEFPRKQKVNRKKIYLKIEWNEIKASKQTEKCIGWWWWKLIQLDFFDNQIINEI